MNNLRSRVFRVLVVEDAERDVALIDRALQGGRFAFESRHVDTEEAFLRELKEHPPDVILSDSGVTGFDTFRALEAARALDPRVPFVLVSGKDDPNWITEAIRRGASNYVSKSRLQLLGSVVHSSLKEAAAASRIQKQVEETRKAIRQREQRLRAQEGARLELEDLARTAAAELRTPLMHVERLTEAFLRLHREQLDDPGIETLNCISRVARQCSRVADELMAFGRLSESSSYRLPFSLQETAEEAIRDLWHETEGRQVEWVTRNLPTVTADPARVFRVFTLLLANALQFTKPRETARIYVEAEKVRGEVRVHIRDNGVGFSQDRAERLFHLREKTGAAKELEGAGIGLAIARRIVEQQGGRIWAEGRLGKGAVFSFSIPEESSM